MRQILVLGLLAAICWWIYDSRFATPVQAAPGDGTAGANAAAPATPARPLSELLGAGNAASGAPNAADPAVGNPGGPAVSPAASPAATPNAATPQSALDAAGQ
ncbi:MAG: hypothetical protein KDE27_19980, partial [Planctomycetes bacterium]|nr:hypothetical protein [Planctomycetota bacterium]